MPSHALRPGFCEAVTVERRRKKMAHGMTRREFAAAAGAITLAGFGLGAPAEASDTKTLRFVAGSDLRVLDPIWTTAYITRNHGYMVFDTLFALDSKFKPHPQMVGDYSISSDQLLYIFKLCNGLKFHDVRPVRGMENQDGLWQEPQGSGPRPGDLSVERGEGVTWSPATRSALGIWFLVMLCRSSPNSGGRDGLPADAS
jgi:hypothetical protein